MSIYEKLHNIQQNLVARKDQFNSFGKYSYRSCESILEALKPLLKGTKSAIILSDDVMEINQDSYIKATATLIDIETGESVSVTAFAREEPEKKGMDSSQITGSASSYARKYALNGLFAIDDNKDSDATNTHGKDEPTDDVLCEKCGKAIIAYKYKDKMIYPAAHAEQCKKKFGKVLCMDCINENQ
jgi:Cft2 family RNA processing exonuclease